YLGSSAVVSRGKVSPAGSGTARLWQHTPTAVSGHSKRPSRFRCCRGWVNNRCNNTVKAIPGMSRKRGPAGEGGARECVINEKSKRRDIGTTQLRLRKGERSPP